MKLHSRHLNDLHIFMKLLYIIISAIVSFDVSSYLKIIHLGVLGGVTLVVNMVTNSNGVLTLKMIDKFVYKSLES